MIAYLPPYIAKPIAAKHDTTTISQNHSCYDNNEVWSVQIALSTLEYVPKIMHACVQI